MQALNEEQRMPEAVPRSEVGRLHQRMDDVFEKIAEVDRKVTTIAAVCGPCQDRIGSLEITLDGNGSPGVKQRLAVVEAGKTDTITVRSFGLILGAVGTLVGAICAAVGALLATR